MKTPLLVALTLSAALALPAKAGTYTWTGGGTDALLSSGGNWSGSSAPALSDTTASLWFSGSTGTTVTAGTDYNIGALIFGKSTGSRSTTDGAFTLSGSTLTLSGVGGYAIYNNTDKVQTINNNVVINSASAIIAANTNTSGLVLNGTVTMGFASGNLSVANYGFSTTSPIVLNGVISSGAGTGGLSLSGNGACYSSQINLNGANTYTGTTVISSVIARLGGNALSGVAGVFGIGTSAVQLGVSTTSLGATAGYTSLLTNGSYTIDRSFQLRQTDSNYQHIVIGSGAAGISSYTGQIQESNGTRASALQLVAAASSTVNFTGANSASGYAIYRSDSATGTTDTVTKIGAGVVNLQGLSNYQGATYVDSGILRVSTLANGGVASSIGVSTSDASNLVVQGGTLQYSGGAASTDRLFTIAASGATLDASGSGAINFTNAGTIVTADAASRLGTLNANGKITFLTADVGTNIDVSDLKAGMLVTDPSGIIPAGTTITSVSVDPTNGLSYITLSSTLAITSATTETLTFGYADATANPTTLTLTGTNTGANTIAGSLTDSDAGAPLQVVKSGTGTWVLSGANTYSGTTSITSGRLQFAKTASLYNGDSSQWTASNITVGGASTLALNVGGTGEFSVDDFYTLLNNLSSGSNNGLKAGSYMGIDTTNAPGEIVLGNAITDSTATGGGSLGFTKYGAGVLTLGASNSYTGKTEINGGVLKLGNASALTQGSYLVLDAGATLDLNGYSTSTGTNGWNAAYGRITNSSATSGTIATKVTAYSGASVDGTGNITFSGGLLGGSFALVKNGNNTMTLAGSVANTSLAMTVNSGTLVLASSAAQGAIRGNDGNGYALTVNPGATVLLGANDQFRYANDLLTGIVALYGGTFNMAGYYSTLNGLRIGSTDGSTAGSVIDTVGGGYLTVTGTGLDGSSAIMAYSGTISGVLAGTWATLTKASSGTVTITSANTYGGETLVTAGELDLNATGTQAIAGNLRVTGGVANLLQANQMTATHRLTAGGGVVNIGSGNQTVGALSLIGNGLIVGSGTVTTATTFYDIQGGTANVVLAGTWGLAKTTAGTATLSAANVYTGTTSIAGGVLSISSFGNGGVASGIGSATSAANNLVFSGGYLQYTGGATSSDRNFTLTSGGGFDASGSGALVLSGSCVNTAASGTVTFNLTGTSTAANTLSGALTNGASAGTALAKSGSGTWVLSGSNSYTGITTINAGILQINNANALGKTYSITMSNGATLDLNGNSFGSTSGKGYITTGNTATLFNSSAVALTSSDSWQGGGTMVVDGTGAITLTGTLNALRLIKNGGNTLYIGNNTAGANVSVTLTANSGTTVLYKTASGDSALRGCDAYGNVLTINTGAVVQLGANDQIRASTTDVSTGIIAVYGGTFDINSKTETINGLQIGATDGSTAGNIISTGGAGTLTVTGSATTTGSSRIFAMNGAVSANLAGAGGGLLKTTSGTVTLSGSNTYTGATVVNAGALSFANRYALYGGTTANWTAAKLDVKSGATLLLALGGTTGFTSSDLDTLVGLGTASGGLESGANLGLNTANGDFTYASSIANPYSGANVLNLRKLGANKLTLSGSSTYTGVTTVEEGTLQVNSNQALGSAGAGTQVSKGASLILNNVNYTAAEALSISGTGSGNGALVNSGSSSFAGQITATSDATINAGGGTLTLTGGLVKNGTVLTLTGGGVINVENTGISGASANSDLVVDNVTANMDTANSYNGPTYIRNGGIVNANVTNALPTANGRSAVVMDDSGTGSSALNLGASQSVASLTGAATSKVAMGGNTLTVGASSGTTNFAGVLSNGSLIKDGASTQILSGVNTYTGSTQVNAGTLTVNGSLAGAVTAVNIGATLNGSGSVAGAVTASGSVAGTLSFGSSVTLQNGASLTGASHNINGLLTVLSGATVSPGTGAGDIGTLTVGSLSLASGALLALDINGTTPGITSDQVITTSNNGLSLGGSLTLTIGGSYTSAAGDALMLILNSGDGSVTSTFSSLTVITSNTTTIYSGTQGTLVNINGREFALTYTAGSGNDVELLAVPEPGTWTMVLGGLGMMLGLQSLRKRFQA